MDESRDKSPTAILLFAKNTSKEEKKKKRERGRTKGKTDDKMKHLNAC